MPSCASVDVTRNRVFAWYGYLFQQPQHQRLFGGEPWYRARADFHEGWLSPVARKHIDALKNGKECEADDGLRP